MEENLRNIVPKRKKHFPIFTIISTLLLVFILFLSVASCHYDSIKSPEYKLTLSDSFHIELQRGNRYPIFGSLTFFNGERPYSGSVVRLATKEEPRKVRGWYLTIYGLGHEVYSNDMGEEITSMYCCDLPGVYYRYFNLPSSTIWTLTVGLWLPLIIFSFLPAVQFWKYRRKKRI